MAEKIRYTRRDLKGPDEFISIFGRAVAWAKENRLRLLAGFDSIYRLAADSLGFCRGERLFDQLAGGGLVARARGLLLAGGGVLGIIDAVAAEQCELRFHRSHPDLTPEVHDSVKEWWASFSELIQI